MSIVVQKFGGTSVATPQAREALINQVRNCKEEGNDIIVVVSAMGRYGDPYATDTLIHLLEQINPNLMLRKKDLMMSCGETISCSLISHLLESNNIPAEPLTGFQAGIHTTNIFGNSEIVNIDTSNIEKLLKEGKVVVVAGFQGITNEGEITTLGRGGSDISAIAIGGYLKAQRVDIFTDVLGIAKIDPRIVADADFMDSVTYDDMFTLAEEGAKVIHPRAVAMAKKFNIPVRVRSTFSQDMGTLIIGEGVQYNHKIIGIAIKKEIERSTPMNVSCPMGKIFILFDETQKEEMKNEIKSYVAQSGLINYEILWGNNNLSILLPSDMVVETVRDLYAYYHGAANA